MDCSDDSMDCKNLELVEDKNEVSENLKKLPEFCGKLEDNIKEANEVLQACYADPCQSDLRIRLKNSVNELICIQREMKAITNNIESMKMQLESVERNTESQKNNKRALEYEERFSRSGLANSVTNAERNQISIRNEVNPPSRFSVTNTEKFHDSLKRSLIPLPTFFDVGSGNRTSTRGNNRMFGESRRRAKFLRRNKEPSKPKGVTLYLNPISELAETESYQSVVSKQSSPVQSVLNIPWMNITDDIQQQSNEPEESNMAEAISVFVFNSHTNMSNLD